MPPRLVLLFFALFVAMIGFGLTVPVLPYFVDRVTIRDDPSAASLALHVGALTSAYALAQFAAAPWWGRWSDRWGRKPLVLLGLAGFAASQVIFGLGTSLWILYAARFTGGLFSGAILVASTAYVADTLAPRERMRAMAWQGTAVSLGFVAGPALGGLLARSDWHLTTLGNHFLFDGFSLPFLAAASLAVAVLPAVLRYLPESLSLEGRSHRRADSGLNWRDRADHLRTVLLLVLVSQAGLTLFEAVFALYGRDVMGLRLFELGVVFSVCGGVMAVGQGPLVGRLAPRVTPDVQVTAGFALLGGGTLSLLFVAALPGALAAVVALALGSALIAPNLLAIGADRSGAAAGAGLGLLNASASAGQVIGPLIGGLLFGWRVPAAFAVSGVLLLGAGAWVWQARGAARGLAPAGSR